MNRLISETYFFRHPVQWDALRDEILPKLGPPPRNFWSAGCSSGPEPYTLSIVAQGLGWTPGKDFTILATDFDPKLLERARRGRYTDWDLRGLEHPERWFDRRGSEWQLHDRYRKAVNFWQHDLHSPPPGHFDLILCRNVLIYFERAEAWDTIVRLGRALTRRGRLMLGYTDACMAIEALPLEDARLALFGRPEPEEGEPPARVKSRPEEAPQAPGSLRPEPLAQVPTLQEIRDLADRGHLDEARQTAEQLVQTRPEDPAAHFHHSLILMLSPGAERKAAEAMRRALYLDADLAAGYYYQGLLRQRLGERRPARRSLETAKTLAEQRQGDSPVKGWEEVTHEQLVGLAESQLELLGSGDP